MIFLSLNPPQKSKGREKDKETIVMFRSSKAMPPQKVQRKPETFHGCRPGPYNPSSRYKQERNPAAPITTLPPYQNDVSAPALSTQTGNSTLHAGAYLALRTWSPFRIHSHRSPAHSASQPAPNPPFNFLSYFFFLCLPLPTPPWKDTPPPSPTTPP